MSATTAPGAVTLPAASQSTDTEWLTAAVDLARQNVADGGGPFGAFIVQDGVELGRGVNRVTRDNDPTAHAEVCAIRAACARKGDFSLVGATLFTSCEPCPLCLSASLWARVNRVLYAADRYDAARGGFDDLQFYELFARDRSEWSTSVAGLVVPEAASPFDTWLASTERVAYLQNSIHLLALAGPAFIRPVSGRVQGQKQVDPVLEQAEVATGQVRHPIDAVANGVDV